MQTQARIRLSITLFSVALSTLPTALSAATISWTPHSVAHTNLLQEPKSESPAAGKKAEVSAKISGVVRWSGKNPSKGTFRTGHDSAIIPKGMRRRSTAPLVNGQGMGHTVVYIKDAGSEPIPKAKESVIIKAESDLWFPYIIPLRVGQRPTFVVPALSEIPESTWDGVLCLHWKSKRNDEWNATANQTRSFTAPSTLKAVEIGSATLRCDIHAWLESRVLVFDHPFYAVTKADGSFSIPTASLKPGSTPLWPGTPGSRPQRSTSRSRLAKRPRSHSASIRGSRTRARFCPKRIAIMPRPCGTPVAHESHRRPFWRPPDGRLSPCSRRRKIGTDGPETRMAHESPFRGEWPCP